MPTLILTSRHTPDSQALWRVAIRRGWNVHRLPGWKVPDNVRLGTEPVLYVDALVGPMIAEQVGLSLEEPPLDWLPNLPEYFRKRWVRVCSLGEARQLLQPTFVKPPNDKSFTAQVYTGPELPNELPDDMTVLIAEVVEWEKEFRCFTLDRTLRTFSVYLRDGELQEKADFACTDQEEKELRSFVETVLSDQRVNLLRAAVLDVGVIRQRGWAVVELNSAWGAGLYGCDPEEVLTVLQRAGTPLTTAGP